MSMVIFEDTPNGQPCSLWLGPVIKRSAYRRLKFRLRCMWLIMRWFWPVEAYRRARVCDWLTRPRPTSAP